jgi:predicted aldo/keto reductase-like oxidoreductase
MSDRKKNLSRRDFLRAAGAAGIGSLVAGTGSLAGELAKRTTEHPVVPTRPFGKTGVDVSILSLGGIFDITSNQLVVHQALEWGVTYWDTATSYVGGKSEIGIGKYFEKHPEARKKIDLFFMHGISSIREADDEMKAWAEKAKSAGKVRFFGFSAHSNMEECLLPAAKLGWIDGIMMTYNYRIMNTDKMKAAVDACAKAGIGLTAMKTQARSFWTSVGKETDVSRRLTERFTGKGFTEGQAKLKAVWENPNIASICSEMPNLAILKSNIAAALDRTKLSADDMNLLEQHARQTTEGYCAGCTHICESGYGEKTPIGDTMRYLMYYNSYGECDRARALFAQLDMDAKRRMPTLDYSLAERRCPQGVPIGRLMKEAAEILT